MTLNILIVDDNRMMREMVAKTVKMSSLAIGLMDEAVNGSVALERLRSGGIDLVLLDLNMPVMDGEALLKAMRAEPTLRDTLVVIVSSESSPLRQARLAGLGAGFVHKPFRPEGLVAEVERLRSLTQSAKLAEI